MCRQEKKPGQGGRGQHHHKADQLSCRHLPFLRVSGKSIYGRHSVKGSFLLCGHVKGLGVEGGRVCVWGGGTKGGAVYRISSRIDDSVTL